QGVEIERKPRSITISAISIFDYDSETSEGFLEISCSKGTYVRTLINDIGEKLLVGGVMTSLIRTRASGFSLNDCLTFEELERSTDLTKFVHSPEKVFMDLPKIMLDDVQTKLYRNGVKLDTARLSGDIFPAERYQVWGENVFIGTAKILSGDLIIEKNFYNR
ncbi:MAG: tRNA pseudouridine(55) synthase TruB, partial [Oscillospiraceae bacterium]